MQKAAFDNVINFPDSGGRAPVVSSEKILLESRDLVARRLREVLRTIVEQVSEELARRGDAADDRDRRNFLYGLKGSLSDKAGRLEAQLAVHWAREFNAVLADRPVVKAGELRLEDMQIVDDGELDEELALKSLGQHIEDFCEEDLYAISRRLAAVARKESFRDRGSPAAPAILVKALQGSLRDLEFERPDRLEFFHCIESIAPEKLAPIYHELNASLVRYNILPSLRRGYGRTDHTAAKPEAKTLLESSGGDVFALLQRLVGGAQGGGDGGVVPGPVGHTSPSSGGSTVPGGLSIPPEKVWSLLDTLQRTTSALAAQSGAMPAANANVLHDFRTSEVGQGLGQLDAITVDIVAMLFDMIFDDREIADPIKALVGKLQIPVLKVAMLDKSFFSSKAHPARRLLDVISRAALRWGREVGHDDPIYRRIAAAIDQLHAEFKQDTTLFDAVCVDLEKFLGQQEEAADAQAARAAPLVVQREEAELAALAVDQSLRAWLALPLPAVVADLLRHEWRSLLLLTRRESGGDSPSWNAQLKTAADLVASVDTMQDVQERRGLARQLPLLVKQLNSGLDRLGVETVRRRFLLDGLLTLHAAVLRGVEPEAAPSAPTEELTGEAVEPTLASAEIGDGEVTVESISLTAPITGANVGYGSEGLQRGDWVEIAQTDSDPVRYRLSWISPQRGIYLFTNPRSPRALAISPDALNVQIERGEVTIVPVEPIFDRAMTRALETLQAA